MPVVSSQQLAQCTVGSDGVSLEECILIRDGETVGGVYDTPASLINVIVPNLFILAGVIFLFLMIFAGVSIIRGDSAKAVEESKKQLTTAVIGFVIMFSAYWIVQVVEFITQTPILNSGL